MNKYSQKLLNLSFILVILCGFLAPSIAQTNKLSAREIAQETLPSVVLIIMHDLKTDTAKTGSGFFVTQDIVVTNFHVIEGTSEGVIKIVGQDGTYDILGTVGVDKENDLVLLKLKDVKGKPLPLNRDDSIAIGDEVFAVGNPKGLEGTFSQGIVSSIRKSSKENLLQITAPISSGSSGGAVLNDKGEVVGVAVGAIEGGQSLNFAIPVSLLRPLVLNIKPLLALSNIIVSHKKMQTVSDSPLKQPNKVVPVTPAPSKYKLPYKTPDIVKENLFGKVKSVKESIYSMEMKFEKWDLGKLQNVKTVKYNFDGYKEYSFTDDKLQNGEWVKFRKPPNPPRNSKLILSGCTNGKEIFKYIYDYVNSKMTKETYAICGDVIDGLPMNVSITKYKDGEITTYSAEGKILKKIITEKDDSGSIVEQIFNANGKLIEKNITSKNENGQLTHEYWSTFSATEDNLRLFDREITIEKVDYIEKKMTSYIIPNYPITTTRIYDKTTNLLQFDKGNDIIFKYEYEFDNKGNWIKKIRYIQVTKFGKTYFEPLNVFIREINYF